MAFKMAKERQSPKTCEEKKNRPFAMRENFCNERERHFSMREIVF